MENEWKQRLYNNYISTGQAGTNINTNIGLNLENYPYYSKLIKKYLPQNKDISILDMACGHGALVYCIKQFGYYNITGIDISKEQVNMANQLGINEVKCHDMMCFLEDKENTFDVIFLIDILEHLNKSELLNCLDQVNKSLTANGIAIIHVPNAEGIFGMSIRYGDLTHEDSFTSQSIKQVLNVCGIFSIECFEEKPVIHGVRSFFRFIIWELLTIPFRILSMAETGKTKHILSQNMLVIAKKIS